MNLLTIEKLSYKIQTKLGIIPNLKGEIYEQLFQTKRSDTRCCKK